MPNIANRPASHAAPDQLLWALTSTIRLPEARYDDALTGVACGAKNERNALIDSRLTGGLTVPGRRRARIALVQSLEKADHPNPSVVNQVERFSEGSRCNSTH